MPYHYGGSTRSEREASSAEPVDALLERHLTACGDLAKATEANLAAQRELAIQLRAALAASNPAAAHAAVDAMWSAYRTMYASLQSSLVAWNALAAAAAGD